MKTLGIVLPTNRYDEYVNYIQPSIQHLVPLNKKIHITFLLYLQRPFTELQRRMVEAHIIGLGLSVRATLAKAEPFSALKFRKRAMGLMPDADFYMFCDDNLVFAPTGTKCYPGGSAERYAQVIDYFERFPNCGTVTCVPSLGGAVQKLAIWPSSSGLIATASGLFFRNAKNVELYSNADCNGTDIWDESVACYNLMSKGFFAAKQFNSPTQHKHLTKQHDKRPGIKDHALAIKTARHYISCKWLDQSWGHSSGKFPKGALLDYHRAGGDKSALHVKFGGDGGDKYRIDYGG